MAKRKVAPNSGNRPKGTSKCPVPLPLGNYNKRRHPSRTGTTPADATTALRQNQLHKVSTRVPLSSNTR